MVGLLGRARRNALDIRIEHHDVTLSQLPPAFDGFTLLQLSDLHLDINDAAVHTICERVRDAGDYDVCVLTGDYRARTFGEFDETLRRMEQLRLHLKDPVYAVLGNHDSIRMVPGIESMGIRVLLNEAIPLAQEDDTIFVAGIDDAHYFRVDNIEKAADGLPLDAVKILLSHTPEIYRQAAHAVPPDDRVHVGGRRDLDRRRPAELSSRDHSASPARSAGRPGLLRTADRGYRA